MDKPFINRQVSIPANGDATKIFEPRIDAFDFPASPVTPKFLAIFIRSIHPIVAIRNNEIHPAFRKAYPQRIIVITLVRNHSLGDQSPGSFSTCSMLFGLNSLHRFLGHISFVSGGTFDLGTQWPPISIDGHHNHRTLASLVSKKTNLAHICRESITISPDLMNSNCGEM